MIAERAEQRLELPVTLTECGSLNVPALTQLREVLMAAVKDAYAPVLVVSLANVRFAGAAFIGVMVESRNRLRHAGRQMRLCDVGVEVMRVLTVCRLTEMFSI
jgi:anti-anti-sigma factor